MTRRGLFASLAAAVLGPRALAEALPQSGTRIMLDARTLHEQYLRGPLRFHPEAFTWAFPPYPCPRFAFAGQVKVTFDTVTGIATRERVSTPFVPYADSTTK
jgi:hypothetical protein